MVVLTHTFSVDASKMFIPLNEQITEFILSSGAKEGVLTVFSRHTTSCIKILENELLSLMDIKQHLNKLASWETKYLHDNIDLREVPPEERINGASHIRSLYFNHSENIPIKDGFPVLGKWQEVFLVELDPHREREVIFTFIGKISCKCG